jgi:uncharacterized protein YciI
MGIILGKYTKPLKMIDALISEHREFLDEFYKKSKFICSGPQDPIVGGVIVANVESVDEARQIMGGDPFMLTEQ